MFQHTRNLGFFNTKPPAAQGLFCLKPPGVDSMQMRAVRLVQAGCYFDHLHIQRLFRQPLLLAMPDDHRLAARPDVPEADIADLTVLSLGPDYAMHARIKALCQPPGGLIARDHEGTSLAAIRQMVGMGVAFLSRLDARSEIDSRSSNVAVRPFRRSSVTRSIELVRRRAANAGMFERLSDIVKEAARTHFQTGASPVILD